MAGFFRVRFFLPVIILLLTGLSHATHAVTPAPYWSVTGATNFGKSVCTAGDVNGDGYSDVIVGNYVYTQGVDRYGRVDLYYGSPTGPSTAPDWSYALPGAYYFGFSVSTAGDVNGDGFDDIIVGAPRFTNDASQEGRAYVFHGSAHGPSSGPDWIGEGNQTSCWFGYAVAAAGDVDGDGYDDILIGAPQYSGSLEHEGRVLCYRGSAGGVSASPSWTTLGGYSDLHLATVSGAADVNGDGYDDVLVGGPGDSDTSWNGMVKLFLGSSGGLHGSPAWTQFGPGAASRFGASVALVGDVNGDGYADALTGSPEYTMADQPYGQVQLWLGEAGGLPASPSWTRAGSDIGSECGAAAFSAGDYNGDGHADIIFGMPGYDDVVADEGYVLLYLGTYVGIDAPGSPRLWIAGDEGDVRIGSAVASAGDVNGDGFGDILIGAAGMAALYLGTPIAAGIEVATLAGRQAFENYGWATAFAGDVNADGYSDLLVGAPGYSNGQTTEGRVQLWLGAGRDILPSHPSWELESNAEEAKLGIAVAAAGDVNNDGYDDILFGASNFSVTFPPIPSAGRAYLFYGSATGIGSDRWYYNGSQSGSLLGATLASAGDVNGDGYGDILVGAPGYAAHEVPTGRVLCFLGSPEGLGSTPDWTATGVVTGGLFGSALAAADINGDGYSDVVIGSSRYSNGESFEGAVFVWYGGAEGLGPNCTAADADWMAESNIADADFGFALTHAGDENGDGFGDFIVGSPGYSSDKGRISIYRGSATGPVISCDAQWGGAFNSRFGAALSAGNVNADAFTDYVVGEPEYDHDFVDDGTARIMQGGTEPCGSGSSWVPYGDQAGARFGHSVAAGGDLNGDGFSDIAVGAPGTGVGVPELGSVLVYLGNKHGWQPPAGMDRIPRQVGMDGVIPVALLGRTESRDGFLIRVLGRTPAGRGKVCLQTEVESLGTVFDGTGLQQVIPSRLVDTGTPVAGVGSAVTINEPALVPGNGSYHWRVRIASLHPFFPRTPWFSLPGNGTTETDLRVRDSQSAVGDEEARGPGGEVLLASSPNPGRSGIRLDYAIPRAGLVRLEIFDPAGRLVTTVDEGMRGPGWHIARWTGRSSAGTVVPAGIYFARLRIEGTQRSVRIALIR